MVKFGDKNYPIEIWTGQQIKPASGFIAVDTETELVANWTETPRMVTLQAFDGQTCWYVSPENAEPFMESIKDIDLVFHNFSFDCDVLCRVVNNKDYFYDRIEADKIWDTSILYRLWHLAKNGWVPFQYNLALLSQDYLNEELPKDDHLRLTWGDYLDKPIDNIPADMLEYGAKDVLATYFLYRVLRAKCYNVLPSSELKHAPSVLSHSIQIKGDIALNRLYKRGIGFNLERAQALLSNLRTQMRVHQIQLAHWGWVRGMKGSKDAFEYAVKIQGLEDELPKTDTGAISSKAEDLEQYTHLEFIKHYIEFHKLEKLTSFIHKLDSKIVHPKYNLLMNTGRTSAKNPNFQNLPREGGIRQLFIAQPGNTFVITDYSTLELCTLAQVCYNRFGHSTMKDKINEGVDLHKYYASVLYSIPVSEVTKEQRQSAKAANFGFPGGLGAHTFIQFAAGYGLELTQEDAERMKEAWFSAFPEMDTYMAEPLGYSITETGRMRGDTTYCAEKNTPFQGLAADGAKIAMYEMEKAGLTLRGFIHDECVVEVLEEEVEKYKKAVESIMIESMRTVCPDVKIEVESTISKEYCK